MAPFLEIVTRAYKRPKMLANNQASLIVQVCDDWRQTLLIDELGRGIGWSTENLCYQADRLTGKYIWLLDDDDECIREEFVCELMAIAEAHDPDVIMVRMDHGPRGIQPDDAHWGQPPAHGHIGMSGFVVRREVYQRHADAFVPGVYHSDFNFIRAVFESGPRVYWHDVIASRVQQIGLGRPE